MLHLSPSPHFLQRQDACHTAAESAFRRSVLSQFLFSITRGFEHCTKANNALLFFAEWPFNQYLQLHSLVHKEPLYYGEFKTTIKITIQILIYLRDLQKYSKIPSTWSWYSKNPYIRQLRKTAPNSRSSGVGNLQLQTDSVFTFCNLTSLSPLSYCNGSQRTQKVTKQLLV